MQFSSTQKGEPALYAVISVLLALTFLSDLFVPLGTAVWIVYLLPTAFAYFVWRPQIPLAVAAIATLLVLAGYLLSSPGVDPEVAKINRGFGILTAWIIGGTGYLFIRSKLAVRKQEWLQAGHVGLAQSAGGEQQLGQLGENVLRFVVEYLEAQAGVIYIRDGDRFQRYASYGVPESAQIPANFDPASGLLGQAVKDRRSFVLQDVPDGYLYFGSGLGHAKPRHLIIAPAKADGEINTVLELGFLKPTSKTQMELLDRVAEPIGIAVRSAKYRVRLQELLEETQRQAEELQAQSEDLRAVNEELEEQSRSLQESQARLELQQSELEQTNAQLEEQTQILESQRDDIIRAQVSLEKQARDLEQASNYKSEFLANMSHELRTPLNSLLIMARLLADNRNGGLTPGEVKFARTIESSGNDLLNLINDILDISKIEAGKVELQPEKIRTASLATKLQNAFLPLATQKGLRLTTEVAPGSPEEIETDAQRLQQVLKNFLSNAIKFTERGEVGLAISKTDDGRVALTVRDTGIGIPSDQQDVIFEAFRQADGSVNRKYGGTGLGLSISRQLSRLLGGEIHVESVVGKGSTFTLIIPQIYSADVTNAHRQSPIVTPSVIPRQTPASEPLAKAISNHNKIEDDRECLSGNSRVILVVEDDAPFAQILCDMAHELDFQCLVAGTADEGVVLARQYLPHAIILDMGLPDHTGMSVLDRLKRDIRTRHIPIHVASVTDYTQTAMSFGAIGYMLKPVKREELLGALTRLETHLTERLRRILIVEDDAKQRESLRELLASRDVETVDAETGADCIERLKSQTFDCMVLDLSLPDISGFDLLKQLSEDEETSFPPVIVYTGRDLTPDEELRLRAFSKSIIIKGAKSPERLLDEVTLFLHQVVSELPEEKQRMLVRSLSRDAALEGRSILIVEDDVRNVFSLTSIFEPHGMDIRIARNGREALQALQQADDGGRPIDLVLMDIMMPEMDGLTATREIRQRPNWKSLPVIALTAKAMQDDQEQCLAAGANDYLAKPLDVDKLLSLVRVWMPR